MTTTRRVRPAALRPVLRVALACAAALAAPALAGADFTLTDARGDDHGDGFFQYPARTDYEPGDLDLLTLTVRNGRGGTWFEATFANPIKVPGREAIDDLGTQLDRVARNGFYNFNLDIYIDTDRVPGSGAMAMMPGRLAEVDPAHAWEKAVVLTPLPGSAEAALGRLMTRSVIEAEGGDRGREPAERRELRREIGADLGRRVFFPVLTRVRGQTIRFFVPESFLGGPAQPGWSYVVAVTGADIAPSLDLGASVGLSEDKRDNLMTVPVSPGSWIDRFGGGVENEALQPPLVDVIVPAGRQQEVMLRDFRSAENRPVRLPGVVPEEGKGS